jgi:hypothetical protein
LRIMVHDIIGRESGGFRVSFSSLIRDGQAVWMGQEPERGVWLDVELEVPIPLTWGAEIALSGEYRSVIRQRKKEIVITGLLEAADEDQVAAVRVGHSLLLVETRGSSPTVGTRVEIRIPELHLYPFL